MGQRLGRSLLRRASRRPSQPLVGAPRPARPSRSPSPPTAACSPPTGSTPAPSTCSSRRRRRAPAAPSSTSGAGTARSPAPSPPGRPTATVWAVDVNQRALDLCRAERRRRRARRTCTVAEPDDVPDDLAVDLIWSNPPIRIGKPALHALLTTWLGRLRPDGHAPCWWSRSTSAPTRSSAGSTAEGWHATRLGLADRLPAAAR